ncbi:5-hydroxytryptamine receptor 1D-like [Lytechinus variegatus]|uniref:5-hydroxytryptamine receptor 1D-like n=1 Tax=Lytechinus variegatus TaxID=7654 RepID=UPI001BB12C71|nr:5-hydroxytryptamine receptor 1D-like [Lytechinus variegatus]
MTSISYTMETFTIWTDYETYSVNNSVTEGASVEIGGEAGSRPISISSLVCSGVFTALIIITNTISLLAFVVEKRLRTYNNYFIINLSILDLLVGVSLSARVAHAYYNRYPFPQDVCKILTGITGGIVNGSNISVVVICADRHRAVYDPINHFISRTKRKAILINCLPWVIGLSFWLCYTTVWEFVVDHDNGTQCAPLFSESPIMYMIQNVCKFHLPFVIIAVLYARIILQIRKTAGGRSVNKKFESEASSSSLEKTKSSIVKEVPSSKIDQHDGGVDEPETEVKNDVTVSHPDNRITSSNQKSSAQRMESPSESRKATRTLSLIIVAFVLTWIPFSLISLLKTIDARLISPGMPIQLYVFFAFLTYGNNLLNPISYVRNKGSNSHQKNTLEYADQIYLDSEVPNGWHIYFSDLAHDPSTLQANAAEGYTDTIDTPAQHVTEETTAPSTHSVWQLSSLDLKDAITRLKSGKALAAQTTSVLSI